MAQRCHVFEVHRRSFTYWKRSKPIKPEQAQRVSKVRELFHASNGSAGSRSIATMASAQGVQMSRYLAAKYMKTLGLTSCQPPDHVYKKTGREHIEVPNLLARPSTVAKPDHVRRCDRPVGRQSLGASGGRDGFICQKANRLGHVTFARQ